jgi:hypothetical protein
MHGSMNIKSLFLVLVTVFIAVILLRFVCKWYYHRQTHRQYCSCQILLSVCSTGIDHIE